MKENKNTRLSVTFFLSVVFSFCAMGLSAQPAGGPPPDGQMGPPPEGGAGGPGGGAVPVIDSVALAGNSKLSSEQILAATTIEPGMSISKELVGGEIERIVALYRQAGLDLAISPDIQHPADGHVEITFKIDENGSGGDAGAAP